MAEQESTSPATGPGRRHTLGQRIYRTLFKYMGPPQVGPPPYATPEELAAYTERAVPPPRPDRIPPGHRFVYYTDAHGNRRRMMIPSDVQPSGHGGPDERTGRP